MIMNKVSKTASIISPSMVHAYSLGMEYIKTWFFEKVPQEKFKHIHISDRDAIDMFREYDPVKSLVIDNPSIAIESRIDSDFLSEPNQMPDGGMDLFLSRTKREAAFYSDPTKEVVMALASQTIKIHYNIRIRVSTKVQQIEWLHFLRMACRIGETQTHEFDMDFHVPTQAMLQLAKDSGFEVKDNRITDVRAFLRYVNQYSYFPFNFKLRGVHQRMEFFIRVMDVSMHLSCLEQINIDEGERINMVTNNFILEFPVTLTMSAPKMYIYYSENPHELFFEFDEIDPSLTQVGLHNIIITGVPDVNDKGWKNFVLADFDIYDGNVEDPKPKETTAYLHFNEIIKDMDVELVFNYVKECYIHPSTFMEFRAFSSHGDEIEYEMDWDKLIGKITKPKYSRFIQVVMYLNKQYVNETLLSITNEHDFRMDPTHRKDK